MVIKKGSVLYTANVGNVLAFIFFSEKIFTYKFEVRQLTFDDSKFSLDTLGDFSNNLNYNNINMINHLNNNSISSNNPQFLNTNNLSTNKGNRNDGEKSK